MLAPSTYSSLHYHVPMVVNPFDAVSQQSKRIHLPRYPFCQRQKSPSDWASHTILQQHLDLCQHFNSRKLTSVWMYCPLLKSTRQHIFIITHYQPRKIVKLCKSHCNQPIMWRKTVAPKNYYPHSVTNLTIRSYHFFDWMLIYTNIYVYISDF